VDDRSPTVDGDEQALLSRFAGKRVLVVGDVMLDEYLWGTACRISPEAPVPVVDLERKTCSPGGAANAAANLAGLGAEVCLAGVVGDDEAAARLRSALVEQGVCVEGLLATPGRPTTTKTRLLAQGQQVARVDHEQRGPLPAPLAERLLRLVEERLAWADACLLSDYAKGAVSGELARALVRRCAALGRPAVVDPKGADFRRYRGATVVKPNLHEAGLALGRPLSSHGDVLEAGRRLLGLLGGSAVLLTRGADGMTLFEPGAEAVHVPARRCEVYDVTGAGDTVAAALALALAAGAGLVQAARLATRAAAVVLARVGTGPVRLAELAARAEE
jgi:D-beta-D-heptose 7-phosphate kinase/D-beta-D-heptose 1-phosphate adenosyltransferase